jgi:hypothetical protein
MLPELLRGHVHIAVGDTHYGGRVMRDFVYERFGTIVLATPHAKQKRGMMTRWQRQLLRRRTKIEAVYDALKEHLHLVSSFPRSICGYLLHYVRILLGYQILVLSQQ